MTGQFRIRALLLAVFVCVIAGCVQATPSSSVDSESEEETAQSQASLAREALFKEDYELLWDVLESSYPYLPYIDENLVDVEDLRKRFAGEAAGASDVAVFSEIIQRMFREMGNFAHLDLLTPEMYQAYYNIYVLNTENGSDVFSEPFCKILQDDRLSDRYSASDCAEPDSQQEETEYYSAVGINYYADCKTICLKIPSFSYELVERDRDIVRCAFKEHPDAEHIIFDITGNAGGSDSYWMENIVAPFGGEYKFNYRNYYKNSALFDNYYADIETHPVSDRKDAPEWLETLGLDRYWAVSMVLPENVDRQEGVPDNIKRWVLTDSDVYSSSDKFACFCSATGWATVVGTQTAGDGLGPTPVLALLPKSGLLIRFSCMAGENPDGTANAVTGTSPDLRCVKGETPLERCLEAIREE